MEKKPLKRINSLKKDAYPTSNHLNQAKTKRKSFIPTKQPNSFVKKPYFPQMNLYIMKIISSFVIKDLFDLISLASVSKFFYNMLYNHSKELLLMILKGLDPKNTYISIKEEAFLFGFCIQKQIGLLQRKYEGILKEIGDCFQPKAIGLNLMNKLLKKLDFNVKITISFEKQRISIEKPFVLTFENFNSSFLCEIPEIHQIELKSEGFFQIKLSFLSKNLRKPIEIPINIPLSPIFLPTTMKKTLFRTYYQFPALLYYFHDDNRLLNSIISIPGPFVISLLQKTLETSLKSILLKEKAPLIKEKGLLQRKIYEKFPEKQRKTPVLLKNSSLIEGPLWSRCSQELDFGLFFKLYDRKTPFFLYFNTKAFPTIITRNELLFILEPNEPISPICLNLTDKIGLKEIIPNKSFIDVILHDTKGLLCIITGVLELKEDQDGEWGIEGVFNGELIEKGTRIKVFIGKKKDKIVLLKAELSLELH